MENKTLEKKLRIFEQAFSTDTGGCYSINLTRNVIEGKMYQIINNQKYCINDAMGLPENARFTEVTEMWEKALPAEEREGYLRFMNMDQLMEHYRKGEKHLSHTYWAKAVTGKAVYVKQSIIMYEEEETGDILAISYFIDLTEQKIGSMELEKTAYQDALTGIGNRSAFTKEMQTYGENPEAACIVADVNNLKLCNDRYGHKAGDKFIADAADCICRGFEKLGKCYRIGGDEFCVLIRKGREKTIRVAIEKVKCLIEEKNAERAMPLSIACGYAIRDNEKETMEQLFNRSDEMMYNVKYRMKQQFPVYCEERIKNYLNVLNILAKSTDDYLYMWSIDRNEFWYFGGVEKEYALQDKGKPMCSAEEVESVVYQADLKMLYEDLGLIVEGKKMVHDMNYRWVNRQGDVVWINCRGKVINDDKGKPFVMIGRVSDTALRYL